MPPSAGNVEQTTSHLPVKAPVGAENGEIKKITLKDGEKVDFVLRTFRCLIADLCQQFGGGHPGLVFVP